MRWLALGVLSLLAIPTAPVLVFLALVFMYIAKRDTFPNWLQWLNTPDDPGPSQGQYEPQVAEVYRKYGWWVKTWYWLGVRNQFNGFFALLSAKYDGTPVTVRDVGPLRVYSVPGYSEWTLPGRRVSFGYKVQTLQTAKIGAPIWWVFMPAFWLSRSY